MKKKSLYLAPVLLGLAFWLWYLHTAADNVAYSDYIRLINTYLPDVDNPEKFFVPDVLTRVPLMYLDRLVNVKLFGLDTRFDMLLGALSGTLGAFALAGCAEKENRAFYPWFLLCLFVWFSLNKWEMLTNGTGWVCFLSISGFAAHFALLDRAAGGGCSVRRERILLVLFPPLLTLLAAGEYCAGYSLILILACSVLVFTGNPRGNEEGAARCRATWFFTLLSTVLSLGLYIWSRSFAVFEVRGAEGTDLCGTLLSDPGFFVTFLLKAFASALLGVNQIEKLQLSGGVLGSNFAICLLGAFLAAFYLIALALQARYRIWQDTILPLLLILSGGLNHLLILYARWIFLRTSYGMSSRYELQYQLGILGILLTFGWVFARRFPEGKKRLLQTGAVPLVLGVMFFLAVLACQAWTYRDEIRTAPYRKEYLAKSREIGLNYRNASDEELEEYLHHSPENVRKAMQILEENRLNIFRDR